MSEQFSIDGLVADTKNVSATTPVADAKKQAIQAYLDKTSHEPTASVGTYSPSGRKIECYRLLYRVGEKVKSIHIRGGNTKSKLAQYRAWKIRRAIDSGASLEELITAVTNFNNEPKQN